MSHLLYGRAQDGKKIKKTSNVLRWGLVENICLSHYSL